MRYWLKQLRKQRNMTQTYIAECMKISRQQYGFIESGKRQSDLNLSIAVKLSEIFDISLDEISKMEQEMYSIMRQNV